MSKPGENIDAPHVYEVHWGDAWVSTSETSFKAAARLRSEYTVSVGFLVHDGDEGIVLAMDWWPKSPKRCKVYTFIPQGMVLEVYHYGET